MRKALICILALCLSLLAAPAAQALVKPGKALPALTLPDHKGRSFPLAHLVKDKVALIVYWSVSCPHCREEIPHILKMTRSLAGNPFVVLFVNTDGKAMTPAVESFAKQEGLPEPWLMDLGPQDSLPLADAYDIMATPAVMVLDRKGVLVLAQELQPNLKQVKKAIEDSF
ncbi:MAG: TlpA disulfide reductase family protein [Thermodesulfobacteriota bacterium]